MARGWGSLISVGRMILGGCVRNKSVWSSRGGLPRESKVLTEILKRQKQQLSLQVLFAIGSSRRRQSEEPVT